MPYRLAHGPISWKHFLNCRVFLSDGYSLCQVDTEFASAQMGFGAFYQNAVLKGSPPHKGRSAVLVTRHCSVCPIFCLFAFNI